MTLLSIRSALGVLTLSAALAQTDNGKTDFPRLGYIFDSSAQALRLVSGIPGAATFGPALSAGAPMLDAALSPAHDYALFTGAADSIPAVLQFGAGAPVTRPIEGAGAAKTVVLSPTGKAALIASLDASSVQIVTGLPAQPTVLATLDISALPGQLEAMGIGDAGVPVISVSNTQTGSSVYLLSLDSAPRLLTGAGQVGAISFFPNRGDVLIADRQNNQVISISDVTGQAAASTLATNQAGVSDPIGIAVSMDGHSVYVANGGGKSILILDAITATAIASFNCSCTPSGLHRMLGKSVFRLTDDVSQPLWVWDGDAVDPHIAFIPAVSDGSGGGAQ